MRKRKWVKPPNITLHEMIRNNIRTTSSRYNGGKDYETTLDSIYFFMHGHNKEEVYNEISKWTDLEGAELNTPIVLPAKFFE